MLSTVQEFKPFDVEKMQASIDRSKQVIDLLEARNKPQPMTIKTAIHWFNEFFKHCPYAAWIKAEDGMMLINNPAYSELHGTDDGYIADYDNSKWEPEEAERYGARDAEALEKGYSVGGEEAFNKPSNRRETFHVAKWVIVLADDNGDPLHVTLGIISANTPLPQGPLLDHDG